MIVICGGQYRSGTTYQFNAVRCIFELAFGERNVNAYFIDAKTESTAKYEIIKTHRIPHALMKKADYVVTTIRNKADIKASMERRAAFVKANPDNRFSAESRVDKLDQYNAEADYFRYRAAYIQKFELIKENPKKLIKDYLSIFEIENITPEQVLEKMEREMKIPESGYNEKTLLHAGHVTSEQFKTK